MSVFQPGNVAYGFSQALIGVFPPPILSQRDPTSGDKASIGTIWINETASDPFILVSIVDNVATWVNINASNSIKIIVTNSGTATPINNVINLLGGANIVTSGSGNTVDVAVTPNIDLPQTNAAGTQGIYQIGGFNFAFAYPLSSTFVGTNAGNTTSNSLLALNNVGVGKSALSSVTTGNSNTAIGQSALTHSTTGLNNVALGNLAMSTLTTGDTNIALGNQSLENILTGNDNIALGFASGSSYTGSESSNIIIGNPGIISESHVIRIGQDGSGTAQQDECFIAGIYNRTYGSTNQVMFADSTGKIGSSEGTNGQVLIASNSVSPIWANLTAGSGVTITNASNSITISSTSASAIEIIDGNTGSVAGTTITIEGGNNILTSGSGTTLVVEVAGTTQHALLIGNSSGSINSLAVATNGQLPIGSTGADPVLATITAGSGVTVTNGAGSITIAATGAGMISTIDGDTGSATGSTITLSALNNAGSTVEFSASGSTVTLTTSDVNHNTLIGHRANTGSGTQNTGVGDSVFANITSGGSNTALGYSVLDLMSTGSNNVGIGLGVMNDLRTGSWNTVLGSLSGQGYSSSESSNILISNTGSGGESNVIRIGTQGTGNGEQDACFIAGIYSVTVGSPQFVTISSSGQLGSTTSSGISTLTADSGSATGSSIDIAGSSNITTSATGATVTVTLDNNVTISGNFSTTAGNIELPTTSSTSVGVITQNNIPFLHSIGDPTNVFLGENAGGAFAASNPWNVGIGSLALNAITTGAFNVAVGYSALTALTSTTSNTAIGYDSMVAITGAGGSDNTALGYTSLNAITTGSLNIAIGAGAASSLTTSDSNNIIIGHPGFSGDNNTIRIGNQGSGSGQQNACYIAGIAGVTVSSSAAVLINTSTGQLGTVVSSRRYKQSINPMEDASSNILDLNPVTFTYKNDPTHERKYGLIAEEVESIFPDLVLRNKAGDADSVKYHDLPVLILNELQKQHNIIAELSRRLDRLEGRSKYESKS